MGITRYPEGVNDVIGGTLGEVRGSMLQRKTFRTFTDFYQGNSTRDGDYDLTDLAPLAALFPGGWVITAAAAARAVTSGIFSFNPGQPPQQIATEIRFGSVDLDNLEASFGFSNTVDPASITEGMLVSLGGDGSAAFEVYRGNGTPVIDVSLDIVPILGFLGEFVSLGFVWDGDALVRVYANSALIAEIEIPAASVPQGATLVNVFDVPVSNTGLVAMDYILATQERVPSGSGEF